MSCFIKLGCFLFLKLEQNPEDINSKLFKKQVRDGDFNVMASSCPAGRQGNEIVLVFCSSEECHHTLLL